MLLNKIPDTTVLINGKEHLYFSGTSYLGISNSFEFQELLFNNIKTWGNSYGSSRNANIKLNVFEKSEKWLSEFLKTEDCVTLSSGTLAGLLTLSVLEKKVDSFFYMPKTHPAILSKKAQPIYKDEVLNPLLLNDKKETICIAVDAIATFETTPYCFNFLQKISSNKKVYLLIDESHSLGVLGKNGIGISSAIKINNNIEKIIVSSFTKAFGVNGGLISGSNDFMNAIRNEALYTGSAPMNPAFLESLVNAHGLYKNQLLKLKDNCNFVFNKINHLDKIRMSKNYPVFFVDDDNIVDFLLSKEIIITSFFYATSPKKINRIVLNANHTKEQLINLCNSLILFCK